MKYVFGHIISYSVALLGLWLVLSNIGCSKKKTNIEILPDDTPIIDQTVLPEKRDNPGVRFAPTSKTLEYPVEVFFDFDSPYLTERAKQLLSPYIGMENAVAEGYTCKFGTNEYNIGLGLERANAVLDFIGGGLARTFGEEKCFAPCENIDERECQQCRRVMLYKNDFQ